MLSLGKMPTILVAVFGLGGGVSNYHVFRNNEIQVYAAVLDNSLTCEVVRSRRVTAVTMLYPLLYSCLLLVKCFQLRADNTAEFSLRTDPSRVGQGMTRALFVFFAQEISANGCVFG